MFLVGQINLSAQLVTIQKNSIEDWQSSYLYKNCQTCKDFAFSNKKSILKNQVNKDNNNINLSKEDKVIFKNVVDLCGTKIIKKAFKDFLTIDTKRFLTNIDVNNFGLNDVDKNLAIDHLLKRWIEDQQSSIIYGDRLYSLPKKLQKIMVASEFFDDDYRYFNLQEKKEICSALSTKLVLSFVRFSNVLFLSKRIRENKNFLKYIYIQNIQNKLFFQTAIFAIIQHADGYPVFRKNMLDELLILLDTNSKTVKKFSLFRKHIARISDRQALVDEKKKQPFGTMMYCKNKQPFSSSEIDEDLNRLEYRRLKLGIKSYKDQFKNFKILCKKF